MNRIAPSACLAVALFIAASAAAGAQNPTQPVAPVPQVVFQDSTNSRETRDRLQQLLRQYPPAVGEVLQRDPSLLNRPDYLAAYPALVAFLQQHPEIGRSPSFFFGRFEYYEPRQQDQALEMFSMILAGIGVAGAGAGFLGVLVWVIRSLIDHRRWLRLSRVQAEVHTKLLDRLTTNEDLLTYIQSPAGRKFLESAPIALEQETRSSPAPLARIIWSMQAGLVLMAFGSGFWFVQRNVTGEASEGFFIIGVLAVALGVGFTASAAMAYLVSTRLGLIGRPKVEQA